MCVAVTGRDEFVEKPKEGAARLEINWAQMGDVQTDVTEIMYGVRIGQAQKLHVVKTVMKLVGGVVLRVAGLS